MTKWMRIAALAVLPMLAACTTDDEGPTDVDLADDVATIRLTIGSQTVDVGPSGASLTFDIPRGNSGITATFLRQSGTPLTLPSTGAYVVRFTSNNTSRITVNQTGPFAATLNGVQSGTATISVSLEHNGHSDFGPHNVTVNVLPPVDN